jgi:hypothetical protein
MTAAEQAGAAIVTTAEVKEAVRALPVRRSPGADGLQLELWRLADLAWAPVLARLFTAIYSQKRTPCHFTDGHITPLHKAGSMCQPSNFRPITLTTRSWLESSPAGLAWPCKVALSQSKLPICQAVR